MKRKKLGRVKPEHLINELIPFSKILVLGPNKEKLGILTRNEALSKAREMKMDLVLISKSKSAPIAKILDYGKYKYQKKKKKKELKSKQSIVVNREVRLTPMIGIHDLNVKSKKAREFLLKGNIVKVSLKFRGRELAKKELGYQKLNEFYETLKDIASIHKKPTFSGWRFLDLYLTLNKSERNKMKNIKKGENQNAKDQNQKSSSEEN